MKNANLQLIKICSLKNVVLSIVWMFVFLYNYVKIFVSAWFRHPNSQSMLLLTHDGYQCMKSWLMCIVNVRCFCDFLLQCVFVCMHYMRIWRIASTYNYACVVRCVMLIKHDCTFKESLYSTHPLIYTQ